MLEYQNLPMWSRLEFVEDTPAVDFIVHKDAVHYVDELNKAKFKEKLVDEGGRWGFGEGCLLRSEDEDGSTRFRIPAKPFKFVLDEPCDRCRGTGEGEFSDKCLYCDGGGKKTKIDWKEGMAISLSMSLLTDCFNELMIGDKKTSSSRLQIMAPFTGTTEMYFPVHGYYSPAFVKWLRSKGETHSSPTFMPDVVDAMISVWKVMEAVKDDNLYPYDRGQFWFNTYDSGWLNISCPGDACGLHPSGSHIDSGEVGYDFSCHNMDNPMQQLVLMAALARFEMNCRKEIEG